ncbi:MAG TPA: hypothetical protein VIT45_10980 [Allosphingosinicella sp.]
MFLSLPVVLLALQVQPRTAPPTPPPPPPRPVQAVIPRPSPEDEAKLRMIPHRIELRVTAEGQILWEGPLMVSDRQQAHINYSKREAAPALCREDQNRGEGRQNNITIGLGSNYGDRTRPSYRLDVGWVRSVEERVCGGGGTRSVSVNQTVLLPVGRSVTVEGDGGLSIEMIRRD